MNRMGNFCYNICMIMVIEMTIVKREYLLEKNSKAHTLKGM